MSDIVKDCEVKMTKTISVLQQEYAAIRAGRANPALLDRINGIVLRYDADAPQSGCRNFCVGSAHTYDNAVGPHDTQRHFQSDSGVRPGD